VTTTCLHLLPENPADIQQAVQLFSVILDTLSESQIAFFQHQQFHLFRKTPIQLLLSEMRYSKQKPEIQHYLTYLQEKKNALQKIKLTTQRSITLQQFFEKNELLFPISAIDQYIFINYFLNNKTEFQILSDYYQKNDDVFCNTAIQKIASEIADFRKSESVLQQAKKQAELANRAKSEFLENMRHDIRTPLTGMIGFAQLIQQEAVSPKTKMYADNLVAATKAFLDFQNDILDMIKSMDDTSSNEIFYLKELILRVIDLIRPKAILKKLEIEFFYDPQLPSVVCGGKKRLFRILLELITNALKFTAQGKISVGAYFERPWHQDIAVRFEIRDTGIGIPEDKKEDVFVRFRRLSPSSDGIYEGVGLGLTLVKKFVKDLQGKIFLQSNLDQGTTFYCYIPFKPVTETQLPLEEKNNVVPVIIKQAHVLLVEDHAMTATVTKLLLQELGCVVEIAKDAKAALRLVDSHYHDLVLMDLGLPDANGLDLAKKIKKIHATMSIVGLTAHVEQRDQLLKDQTVLDDLLQKPMLKSTAIALIERIMMQKPIIDLSLGAQKINQNEEAAKSMLALLVKHLDEDELQIQEAHRKKNWGQLRALMHKMLGGLAYCGAPRLENACKKLYFHLKRNEVTQVPNQIEQVLQEIVQLKKAFVYAP